MEVYLEGVNMLGLIGAGVGLGLSLYGENQRKKSQQNDLNKRKNALREAKYTSGEKSKVLAGVERKYNTANLGEMNSAALGTNRVLNSDTLRGLNASKLLGQRTEALVDTETNIDQHNKSMDSQIAGVPDADPVNAGNVIQGGILGYQGGEALEKLSIFDTDPDVVNPTTAQETDVSGVGARTGGNTSGGRSTSTPYNNEETIKQVSPAAKTVSPAVKQAVKVAPEVKIDGKSLDDNTLAKMSRGLHSGGQEPGRKGMNLRDTITKPDIMGNDALNTYVGNGTQRTEGSKRYEDQERYTGQLEDVPVLGSVDAGSVPPLNGVSKEIRRMVGIGELEDALDMLNKEGSSQAYRQNDELRDWILSKLGK